MTWRMVILIVLFGALFNPSAAEAQEVATAKARALKILPALLARADDVVEK